MKSRQLWEEKIKRVNGQLTEILKRQKVRLVPTFIMRVDPTTGSKIDVAYDLVPDLGQ